MAGAGAGAGASVNDGRIIGCDGDADCAACADGGTRVGSGGGGGIDAPTGATSGAAGGDAHPPTRPAITASANNIDARATEWRMRMGWILLEAGIALGIGIFIAWWLMRGKNDSPRDR